MPTLYSTLSVSCGRHSRGQLFGFDLSGKAKHLERPDPVPVHVNFIPSETVTRRCGVGMMIIVPALTEDQQCDEPVVRGHVMRGETSRTPHVRGRIDQPCGMQAEHGPHEN